MSVDVDALYRRYGPMVLRRCRHLLGNEQEAVDAMQDVFVQVLRRQHTLTADAPSSLLFRTATNVCLNRLRSRRRRPEEPGDDLLLRIANSVDVEGQSVGRNLLQKLFRREQPSTRTIAVLHLLDGMTHEEVAKEVGLSVSGVRKRLRLLRQHMLEIQGAA